MVTSWLKKQVLCFVLLDARSFNKRRPVNNFKIKIVFVCSAIRKSFENCQGEWCQEYCSSMKQKMVIDIPFMNKIYKQAVTYIYCRKHS